VILAIAASKGRITAASEPAVPQGPDLDDADGLTLFADDVYKTLVQNGQTAPLAPENLGDIAGLENAYEAVLERTLGTVEFPDDMSNEELHEYQVMILSELAVGITLECQAI